ncbi:type IIG restriction enzyme/methyltransferase [Hymenobacter psychrophilus]|uniref:site-specific DNA-methyltransferase (adenine-specific) n=1 Tax=Hymenobacter psychrophilus TaxID=651662 RepID=A0A1H3DEV9_9BACT|nr:TaqI-like C-terminal specificity domain-containing protein [Hymenobacter psychrophilus]SDX64870.1 TaqI-like C-terminal specificity domain-containing protein [Hymenobacter psychrophilus]
MKLAPILPSQALDLAFRRQKTARATLDAFEAARLQLLHELDATKDEADMVQPLSRFFGRVGLGGYYLNSHGKRDLVLRTGPAPADPFGVLFELKHRKNPGEMVRPDDFNRKALHELLLYYFQERTAEQQLPELRQLVLTTGYEWFIIDAHEFHRVFWKYTALRQHFQKYKQGQTTSPDTADFYKAARELLDQREGEPLRFTHFSLDPHDEQGRRRPLGERERLWLSKVFSPPHLLKEPFAQDANTLNRAFYEELLYLMGLEEVKDKGRKLIQRCAPERRQRGSLLENTLVQLRAEDMLRNLPPEQLASYGPSPAEQATGVALELGLTWISRLLFLKLLEGQLRRYHQPGPDEAFRFLDPRQLQEYDQLNLLFYRVLNRPAAERERPEADQYGQVPYLNSSLFEPSALERLTLRISGLDDKVELPLLGAETKRRGSRSVLRQEAGGPAPSALTYLLRFLDAYDFASEGSEQVEEADAAERPLISAAVLGLIFEKINGYRDGSFYTPGFITMYMCRHTLRRAVVGHFNGRYGWQADDVPALRELLAEAGRARRPEFSAAFNELRVLDPAVGSGHFLVSALNELLVLKSELRLLLDAEGELLPYTLTVARDELVILDRDYENLFEYRATFEAATGQRRVSQPHTRLQSALFREKRLLIEHCLYGVDLNPNSVRICRLRLWIELLKHAYYTPESQYQELETLPNLELNVRAGNSLISRYPLQSDLTEVFRKKDFSLAAYRRAVSGFFSARGREQKLVLEDFLQRLKDQFRTDIQRHDPLLKRIARARDEMTRAELDQKPDLFGKARLSEEEGRVKQTSARQSLEKLEHERQQREQGTLYREAFEWRFEFPEVLRPDGSFRGFDAVLGNPPYGSAKQEITSRYVSSKGNSDLYSAFIEQAINLTTPNGIASFIVPVSWLSGDKYSSLREQVSKTSELTLGIILPYGVFTEAFVDTGIFSFKKNVGKPDPKSYQTDVFQFGPKTTIAGDLLDNITFSQIDSEQWTTKKGMSIVFDNSIELLKEKMSAKSVLLGSISVSARGILANPEDIFQEEQDLAERLFVGSARRYSLQEEYSWVLYGDNLKEKPSTKSVFQGTRLLVRRLISRQFRVQATITESDFVSKKDIYTLKVTNADYNPYYILGIVNSEVVSRTITGSSTIATKNDFSQLGLNDLRGIPIPAATAEQQAPIAALVEQVLAAKALHPAADTAEAEQQLDALVAALYGLSDDEISLLGG